MPLYLTLRQHKFNPRQKLSSMSQLISSMQFRMLLQECSGKIVMMAGVELLATNSLLPSNLLTVVKSMMSVPIGWLV